MARVKKTRGQRVWVSGHVIDYLAAKGYDIEHLQVAIEHELINMALRSSPSNMGEIRQPVSQGLETATESTNQVVKNQDADPPMPEEVDLDEVSAEDIEI